MCPYRVVAFEPGKGKARDRNFVAQIRLGLVS